MKKNCSVFLFFCFGCVFNVFAQASATSSSLHDHDKMIGLIERSQNIILPDSVIQQLKVFALKKGYLERAVLKNTYYLSPIFNTNLSKEERLFAATILLRDSKFEFATYPTSIVENVIDKINKN